MMRLKTPKFKLTKMKDSSIDTNISLEVSSKDFTTISKNLDVLQGFVKVGITRILATNLVKVLASAQPRVPIDTGELRESGNARIMLGGRRGLVVARGTASGKVNVMLDKINWKKTFGVKKVDAIIEYKRMRGDFDVALWTHEDLNPHGGISPAARTAGTGPKYLEMAWKWCKNDFIETLRRATTEKNIANSLKRLSKRKGRPGRYTVDQVILVRDRVDKVGFYK